MIAFTAGFGPDWAHVPADLAQAVMLLAAYYYEYRHEMRVGGSVMPYGVASLVDAIEVQDDTLTLGMLFEERVKLAKLMLRCEVRDFLRAFLENYCNF